MSYQEIIKIPPDTKEQSALLNHLRHCGRRWSRIAGLRWIFSIIRRGMSVAEPTSSIYIDRTASSTSSAKNDSITVISANLCHDWPFQRRQISRLEAFADMAEGVKADIILLQEVARTSSFKVDHWLVERMGMSSIYSRANGSHKIGFEEGLAVLSRFPLTEPKIAHLRPTPTPVIHRLVLGAQATTPAGPLWVFSLHLGLNHHHNLAQQASLRHMITLLPDGQPALLGGDFNSHESSPQIRENSRVWIDTYRYLHPQSDATTHSFHLPGGGSFYRRRLDYIFLRASLPGWDIQETGHLHSGHKPHSDHHAVYTRLGPIS